MKKLLIFLFSAMSIVYASPAKADNEPCSGKGSCEGKQGDCREVEKGGYCEDNDLSPSFQDSPVEDSFNLVVCLPGSTCNIDEQQGESQ